MANHKDHKEVGIVAGLIAATLTLPSDEKGILAIAEVIGGGIGGAGGACLPDILEPATSSYHRKFFHGVLPAGMAVKHGTQSILQVQQSFRNRALNILQLSESEQEPWRKLSLQAEAVMWAVLAGAVVGAAAGYGSHLVLDAMTPRGLPLLC